MSGDRRSHTVRSWRRPKSQKRYKARCLDCGWAWTRKKGIEPAIAEHLETTMRVLS